MDAFDFWEKWGIELNDKQFANAFTALGVLAASSYGDLYRDVKPPPPENEIMARLSSLIHQSVIPWTYPRPNQSVKVGPYLKRLSNLDAQAVAQSWEKVCDGISIYLRFPVVGHPASELIRPWFRLLFEAAPQPISFQAECAVGEAPGKEQLYIKISDI